VTEMTQLKELECIPFGSDAIRNKDSCTVLYGGSVNQG